MKSAFLGLAATALMSVSVPSFAQSANAQASAAVDVNTATVAELRAIGFTRRQATKMVDLAKQDPFDNLAELKAEVKSVGNRTIARLKGQLLVGSDLVGDAVASVGAGVSSTAGGVVSGVTGAAGGLLGGVSGTVSGSASASGRSSGAADMGAGGVVDINTATAQQLQSIGFSWDVAAAIVADARQDRIDNVKELQSEVPAVTDDMLARLGGSLEIGADLLSVLHSASVSLKLNGCVNNPACDQ